MRFIDLFAGMGGFHYALEALGHECVFASEIDPELAELYRQNFYKGQPDEAARIVHGNIRESKGAIPPHELLCAGFPCQPFSKSGSQNGRRDRTRGTLFHEIIEILEKHRPPYVLLENVGNFERHNRGRTWKVVRESLKALGYDVRGTTHKASGGHGLISPHHLGYPHTRERFFIVASQEPLPADPFPRPNRGRITSLRRLVEKNSTLSAQDRRETALTPQQIDCIDHWNALLARLPKSVGLPSFPIWGEEIRASYPFESGTPWALPLRKLRRHVRLTGHRNLRTKRQMLSLLPPYARSEERHFPDWKVAFIKQNRLWFSEIRRHLTKSWIDRLEEFPPSLRKLEWNCKGEARNLWRHMLQFRPSGLRVKRYNSVPALVAMTSTQIPILGPKRRSLTRVEGLRLQEFPDEHLLPASRAKTFAALGNAVHVEVVKTIAERLLGERAP